MKISAKNKDKIAEQILAFLYSVSPKPLFTLDIATEIARNKAFVKKLLLELREKSLVAEIKKNPKGKQYKKRSRWQLSNQAYEAYRKKQ